MRDRLLLVVVLFFVLGAAMVSSMSLLSDGFSHSWLNKFL